MGLPRSPADACAASIGDAHSTTAVGVLLLPSTEPSGACTRRPRTRLRCRRSSRYRRSEAHRVVSGLPST